MRFGVIAEGVRDEPIFEELIPKIDPSVTRVAVRPTRGKPRFLSAFPDLLWTFPYMVPGGLVDKAIVIRDANGDDPAQVEAAMQERLAGRRHPPFHRGVEFHATRRESETWLLADVAAVNRVAARKGTGMATAVAGPLEAITDAKERFIHMLSEAGLLYVDDTVREIVREIDLSIVRLSCPGFLTFEAKVKR